MKDCKMMSKTKEILEKIKKRLPKLLQEEKRRIIKIVKEMDEVEELRYWEDEDFGAASAANAPKPARDAPAVFEEMSKNIDKLTSNSIKLENR
jgi:hypothetical protein